MIYKDNKKGAKKLTHNCYYCANMNLNVIPARVVVIG
jgi:hypothetical protein